MGTGLKFLFEEGVIMNQGTNLGSQIGRWIILAALVALLGALLLTIRPVVAQDAAPVPDPIESRTIEVPENSVDVYTFSADDPDVADRKLFWTLGGPDAARFSIDGGVLSFKSPPNYEGPADGDEDPIAADVQRAGDNAYQVTVRVGSGGEDGEPGDNNHTGDDVEEIEVTVNVLNVNEDGWVVIYPRQPQIGSTLSAYLTDPDGSASSGIWQWARSDSDNGPWEDIPALSTGSTYRPTGDELDKYLRVTVKYVDAAGGTPDEPNEAMVVSTLKVREDTVTSNAAPKFPDQRTLGLVADVNADGTTTAPLLYARLNTERFIDENSPGGTNVGAPVTAFDDATRIDKLGYSLSDGTGGDGDAGNFRIDVKTGQITVAPGARLDADVETPADAVYNVNVTAIDGDEASSVIAVTIRVLDLNEGPKIRSTYLEAITDTGHEEGERVPTEMSHPEVDRRSSEHQAVRNTLRDAGDTTTDIPMRPATVIDTDLDNGVTYIDSGTADPAYYYAFDPDDGDTPDATGETADLVWSLEGPDKDWLIITKGAVDSDAGLLATLSFKKAPDWEMPRGKARSNSNNNVYEVTLVVTDQNSGLRDELPVTVKVINSGEDNEPGKVKILNRQPEIGVELVAELTDPDTPLNNMKWQWYRAVTASNEQGAACPSRDPFAETTPPPFRYFLDTAADTIAGDWQAISGAAGTGTVAKYTPDFDGPGATDDTTTDTNDSKVVEWSGGDIGVTVTTDRTATPHTVTYSSWDDPKCLRAAFTYDDDVDRTFQQADPDPNDGVNQTFEGAFVGSENSVKRHDLNNNKPLFREIEDDADGGPAADTIALTYTAEKAENVAGTDRAFDTALEVLPAQDVADPPDTANDEDDRTDNDNGLGNDRLTYSLEGDDAKYFVIVGSVDYPTAYGTIADEQGELAFKDETKLNYDRPDGKRVYRVTIRATDPSGDRGSNTIDVIVNITDVNEAPEWVKPAMDDMKVRYEENGKDPVFKFDAQNPERPNPGPGIKYQLVTDATVSDTIDAADIADMGQFSINELNGNLNFRSPPNYEKPKDVDQGDADADDNVYHVAVQAVAADPEGTAIAITTVYRKITVIVTDVNEPPVFLEEAFTLRIKENADSVHLEPTPERGPLYQVNRGVGIPGHNLPVAPNLDVGTPMLAGDDDSTGNFAIVTSPEVRDRVDGLTYELMGSADVLEAFVVVPATGQILSQKKLDHELKSTYEVKVKATDPDGAYDTIDLTIEVTNEEERPIPVTVQTTGAISHSQEENSADDLGDYTATATGTDATPALSLGGDDKDYFTFTGTGGTKTLKFKAAPDYENPRGDPMSEDNSNTYMVTVMGTVKDTRGDDVTDTKNVTIMVTNDPELGTLSGSETDSINEGDTDLGTYTLSEIEDGPTVTWSKEGVDADQFMLEGTGMSRMLKFSSAPDYEMPRGMAMSDTNTNTYMVTVKASAGGEMKMVEVTIMVTNVDELDTLSGPGSASTMEGMDAVGTYMADGTMADMATWTLDGADASQFMLDMVEGSDMSRMLKFSSAPDYEMPRGMAMSDTNTNTYMVTVKASAGGEMAMQEVTVMVTNVDELDTLSGPGSASTMEGMDAVGTYMADGTMADMATWTLDGADASQFMLDMVEGSDMSRMLKFSSAPDYEMPRGMAMSDTNTNTYMVTVKASAGGEMAMQEVTVMVTNMDELGTLSGPDSASNPENSMDTVATYTVSGPMADTATWNVEGADANYFTITGGMLKFSSAPDYEMPRGMAMSDTNTNTYMVTVKASAGSEMAMQPVTITVTDVDELGTLSGPDSASNPENSMDTVATYTLTGGDGSTVTWTTMGADADYFTIMDGMLKFKSAPDYEMPRGMAMSDTNTNTYMVTVMAEAGGEMAMQPVTITVTDVDELGMLTGMESPSHPENSMDTVATYMVSGPMADTATWNVEGADANYFTITGGMLKFSSAPDYEMPRGMAMSDTNTNTYMVTVMAEAGSEMAMQAVAVMVTNVVELGMLTGPDSASNPENSMDTVATYTLTGTMADMATWTLEGDDAESFMLEGTGMSTMLKFSSAPDYEAPADADSDNTYMVTVKAEAGSEMAMQAVAVMVTNVVELGMLTGMENPSHPENSMDTVATYTVSGGDGTTVNWSLGGADGSHFMLDGTDMSRMLKFKSAPDYEMPRGTAMSDDNTNTYMVTVKAEAGGVMEMVEVTVMVTNEEEDGTVTLSTMSPAVGSEVTASLTDLDGSITGTTWQWASADAMDGDFTNIDGATSASYTPVEDDAGMYLQATASYTDGHGTGKMATSETVMVNAVTTVGRYDTDGTPGISVAELFVAVDDYFDGELTIAELFEVINAHFG